MHKVNRPFNDFTNNCHQFRKLDNKQQKTAKCDITDSDPLTVSNQKSDSISDSIQSIPNRNAQVQSGHKKPGHKSTR